jgi:hypothetical protein
MPVRASCRPVLKASRGPYEAERSSVNILENQELTAITGNIAIGTSELLVAFLPSSGIDKICSLPIVLVVKRFAPAWMGNED